MNHQGKKIRLANKKSKKLLRIQGILEGQVASKGIIQGQQLCMNQYMLKQYLQNTFLIIEAISAKPAAA